MLIENKAVIEGERKPAHPLDDDRETKDVKSTPTSENKDAHMVTGKKAPIAESSS